MQFNEKGSIVLKGEHYVFPDFLKYVFYIKGYVFIKKIKNPEFNQALFICRSNFLKYILRDRLARKSCGAYSIKS